MGVGVRVRVRVRARVRARARARVRVSLALEELGAQSVQRHERRGAAPHIVPLLLVVVVRAAHANVHASRATN